MSQMSYGGGKKPASKQPNPDYVLARTKEAATSKSYPIQNRTKVQTKQVLSTKSN